MLFETVSFLSAISAFLIGVFNVSTKTMLVNTFLHRFYFFLVSVDFSVKLVSDGTGLARTKPQIRRKI